MPNPYQYVKAVREMLKVDTTVGATYGQFISETPFRFKWGSAT